MRARWRFGLPAVLAMGVLVAVVAGAGSVVQADPVAETEVVVLPTRLPAGVVGVAAGSASGDLVGNHSCAALTNGQAWCWGSNLYGQLGNPAAGSGGHTPVQVRGLPKDAGVRSVAAGDLHSCAVLTNGQAWCWGDNRSSELGNREGGGNSPVKVLGLPKDIAVRSLTISGWGVGGNPHSCALLTNGQAWCWGGNGHDGRSPRQALGLPKDTAVQSLAAGAQHTCAVLTNGQAWCWGSNYMGQLGDPAVEPLSAARNPVQVVGLPKGTAVRSLAAGADHTCAVLTNGQAWCWGRNLNGELGILAGGGPDADGNGGKRPVRVSRLPKDTAVQSLAAGADNTCAVLTNGQAWCWGDNRAGQLGNPAAGGNSPVQVGSERPASPVATPADLRAPTTATGPEPPAAARTEAARVIGLADPPPGSTVLTRAPAGLDGPALPGDLAAAEEFRIWSVPLTMDAVRQWAPGTTPIGTRLGAGGVFLAGHDSHRAPVLVFDVPGDARWKTDQVRFSIAPRNRGSIYLRADALVMPVGRPPTPDGGGDPRMRITVAAPCPAHDSDLSGVTNPDATDLDRTLVPTERPTAARVCTYSGDALAGDQVLDATAAGRLSAAAAALPPGNPYLNFFMCSMLPAPDPVVIAFSYPDRPDVDLWSIPDCPGDLVDNGHILAGDPQHALRPSATTPTSTHRPPE